MVKKEGYIISYFELENYIVVIVVFIFVSDGMVVVGISILGLVIEYNESNILYFIVKVKEIVYCILKEFGFLV